MTKWREAIKNQISLKDRLNGYTLENYTFGPFHSFFFLFSTRIFFYDRESTACVECRLGHGLGDLQSFCIARYLKKERHLLWARPRFRTGEIFRRREKEGRGRGNSFRAFVKRSYSGAACWWLKTEKISGGRINESDGEKEKRKDRFRKCLFIRPLT